MPNMPRIFFEDETNYHIYESILSRFLYKSVKETQSNLSKMKKTIFGRL